MDTKSLSTLKNDQTPFNKFEKLETKGMDILSLLLKEFPVKSSNYS